MKGTNFGYKPRFHIKSSLRTKGGWYREDGLRAGTAPEDQFLMPKQLLKHKHTLKEDDLAEEYFPECRNPRPPCRQNEFTYELEDKLFTLTGSLQKQQNEANEKRKFKERPSLPHVNGDLRPPSRHKTPPKAIGLDLPPKNEMKCIDVDFMHKNPLTGKEIQKKVPVSFNKRNFIDKSAKRPGTTKKKKAPPIISSLEPEFLDMFG